MIFDVFFFVGFTMLGFTLLGELLIKVLHWLLEKGANQFLS